MTKTKSTVTNDLAKMQENVMTAFDGMERQYESFLNSYENFLKNAADEEKQKYLADSYLNYLESIMSVWRMSTAPILNYFCTAQIAALQTLQLPMKNFRMYAAS